MYTFDELDRLEGIAADIKTVAGEVREQRARIKFLERVLAQAVLTHGDKLVIDPSKCTEAVLALESLVLEFGDGAVRLSKI